MVPICNLIMSNKRGNDDKRMAVQSHNVQCRADLTFKDLRIWVAHHPDAGKYFPNERLLSNFFIEIWERVLGLREVRKRYALARKNAAKRGQEWIQVSKGFSYRRCLTDEENKKIEKRLGSEPWDFGRTKKRHIEVKDINNLLKVPSIFKDKFSRDTALKEIVYPVGRPCITLPKPTIPQGGVDQESSAPHPGPSPKRKSLSRPESLGPEPKPSDIKYKSAPIKLEPKPGPEPSWQDPSYKESFLKAFVTNTAGSNKLEFQRDHDRWEAAVDRWKSERKQKIEEAVKAQYRKDHAAWSREHGRWQKAKEKLQVDFDAELSDWKKRSSLFESKQSLIEQKKREIDLTVQSLNEYYEYYEKINKSKLKIYLTEWENENKKWQRDQSKHISHMQSIKAGYESSSKIGIEKYFQEVLSKSMYPSVIPNRQEIFFDKNGKMLLVQKQLPNLIEVDIRKDPERSVSKRDHSKYGEFAIYAVAIRSVYEVCAADYRKVFGEIAFNGTLMFVDPKDGNTKERVVVSLRTNRKDVEGIKLEGVDPKAALRSLGGIASPSLKDFMPINPILTIDKSDKRIVQGKDVLGNLSETQNLASMDWQDFEYLVRELIEKEFSGPGTEVHVTQASKDQGVDAIAFDEDPIRGGKFVIQAKRYTNVVSVAAARDLYGTVINEGANRGILITTSSYGPDTREFVKDKPIALISGAELLGMFERHGYSFRINLEEAKIENRADQIEPKA